MRRHERRTARLTWMLGMTLVASIAARSSAQRAPAASLSSASRMPSAPGFTPTGDR